MTKRKRSLIVLGGVLTLTVIVMIVVNLSNSAQNTAIEPTVSKIPNSETELTSNSEPYSRTEFTSSKTNHASEPTTNSNPITGANATPEAEALYRQFIEDEFTVIANRIVADDQVQFDNFGLISTLIEDVDKDGKNELITVSIAPVEKEGIALSGEIADYVSDSLLLSISSYRIVDGVVQPIDIEPVALNEDMSEESFPPLQMEFQTWPTGSFSTRVSVDWNHDYLIIELNRGIGGSSAMARTLRVYSFENGKQTLEKYFVYSYTRYQHRLIEVVEGREFFYIKTGSGEEAIGDEEAKDIQEAIAQGDRDFVLSLIDMGLGDYATASHYETREKGTPLMAVFSKNGGGTEMLDYTGLNESLNEPSTPET